jgi:hypothetical protein
MINRFTTIVTSVCYILLTSCAPSASAVQTAVAQTQSAMPTEAPIPTSTRVAIAKIKLEPEVIHPEDLGLVGGELSDSNPEIWPLKSVPNGDNHLSRKLLDAKGEFAGWVSIFLFESQEHLQQAFGTAQINITQYKTELDRTIGDQAAAYDEPSMKGIIFTNGPALVSVALRETSTSIEMKSIAYYADSLNSRVASIIGK